MYEFLWFIAGATAYRFLSHLLHLGHSISFFKEVQIRALMMLGSVVEDVAFMRTIKYKTMEDSNLSSKEIDMVKEVDGEVFNSWKQATIEKVKLCLPPNIQGTALADGWDDAMQYLDQIYKQRLQSLKEK